VRASREREKCSFGYQKRQWREMLIKTVYLLKQAILSNWRALPLLGKKKETTATVALGQEKRERGGLQHHGQKKGRHDGEKKYIALALKPSRRSRQRRGKTGAAFRNEKMAAIRKRRKKKEWLNVTQSQKGRRARWLPPGRKKIPEEKKESESGLAHEKKPRSGAPSEGEGGQAEIR